MPLNDCGVGTNYIDSTSFSSSVYLVSSSILWALQPSGMPTMDMTMEIMGIHTIMMAILMGAILMGAILTTTTMRICKEYSCISWPTLSAP